MWLLEDREVSWPSRTVLEEGSFFFGVLLLSFGLLD